MSNFFNVVGLSSNNDAAFENYRVIKDAVNACNSGNYNGIILPDGKYPLYNQRAVELKDMLFSGKISATDNDYFNKNQNIVFDFYNLSDFKLIGNNTTLLFEGLIAPFDFKNCKNVIVKGITIDWINPLYFIADVIAKKQNNVFIKCKNEEQIMGAEPIVSIQNVNLENGEQGGMALFENISNVVCDGTQCSFSCAETEAINIADSLVIRHIYNYAPAIHFYRCKNVTIEDVTIHSAAGMGIIGQKVENINLYRLYVKPSNRRPMSTNTDATHFINCSGLINFNTCYFEGMGDDATNVHGFYLRIKKVEGNKIYFVQEQQCQDGINYCPDIGQKIEFVNSETLQTNGEATVKSVDFDNENGCGYIYFEEDIGSIAKENDCVANATEVARLNFENCTVKNIRGRGVLLQTRGAVIKNCLFKGCTGEGVHICTETGWWESISTRDILITENRFIDCGFGSTKYCDAVAVVTSTNAPKQTVGVHKDIEIIGNYIIGENRPMLISCAENVLVSGNLIGCKRGIEISNSENIIIKDNKLVDYDDIFKINPDVFADGKE